MTNFEQAKLKRMLKLRADFIRGKRPLPEALSLRSLAERFGMTQAAIKLHEKGGAK